MKRIFSVFFVLFFGMSLLMTTFPVQTKSASAVVEEVVVSEKQIKNTVDLLTTEKHNYPANLATETLNASPVDMDTKTMMSGYVITPKTDDYGQTTKTFTFKSAEILEGQSVFLWIYIPELWFYDLKISISIGYGSASWSFSSGTLKNIASENDARLNYYGWKLFELLPSDCDEDSVDLTNKTLSSMTISYKSQSADLYVENAEPISFYHVFVGDSVLTDTGILYHQDYAIYKMKESFHNGFTDICLGDSFSVVGIYDIFEYVFVGKSDLRNYSNIGKFTWKVIIRDTNSALIDFKVGEKYFFKDEGWYSINIKLFESKSTEIITVVNTSQSFYVDNFCAGVFSVSNLKYKAGNEYLITFTFADSFVSTTDVIVESTNNKVASVTYYTEDGVCYITLKAKKRGRSSILLKVSGYRDGEIIESEEYAYLTEIKVLEGKNSWRYIIIWIVFGIFCTGMLIFLVISFVKARKFDVK